MRKKVLVMFLVVAVLVAPLTVAGAQATSMIVIAGGLNNPRGITFGPDGNLYVAEAGVGGDGPCIDGPEGPACYGPSGSITRVDLTSGEQGRIATGLPSLGEFGSLGPHDIAFKGRVAAVVIGLGADPAMRETLGDAGAGFGQIVQLKPSGKWRFAVDVAAFESSDNPDGGMVDSNPYAVTPIIGGFAVADAGGNDLLKVSNKGAISTLAVFPDRLVEFPPGSGEMIPMQAVPTSVAVGPDHALYVGQLTGFPFPPGGANVYRVVPGEEPEVFASGFTNIIDLAFGPDGNLYALEISANGLLSVDPTDPSTMAGALIQVAPDGTQTTIASDGLVVPGGLVIAADGTIYVTNYSIFPGMGEVVMITP